jgi:cytochrome b subunit of formate dehydrogenase
MLTGIAFWSPWMAWIAVVLGGGLAARMLHPWVGLIFTCSVVYMYLLWRKDMLITDVTVSGRKPSENTPFATKRKSSPGACQPFLQQWALIERFNLGQKYLFCDVLGGIALPTSALVLWFTEYIVEPQVPALHRRAGSSHRTW